MCCASAALPPLPQIRILFPFFRAWHIRSPACWIAGKPLLSTSRITRKCSAKVSDAMLLVSESVMCVDLKLSDELQFVAAAVTASSNGHDKLKFVGLRLAMPIYWRPFYTTKHGACLRSPQC